VSVIYEELAERIRGEALDLESVVQRALRAWVQAQRSPGEQAYLSQLQMGHGSTRITRMYTDKDKKSMRIRFICVYPCAICACCGESLRCSKLLRFADL
jgi:hypothetical protein